MTDDPRQDIARMIDEGQPVGDDDFDPAEGWGGQGTPPEPPSGGVGDPDDLKWCAQLDHSDTDNGKRLIRHFGADLVVMAQDEVSAGSWLAWTGQYWDLAGGLSRANVVVQRLGDLIIQEAAYLEPTPRERKAIDAAEPFAGMERSDLNDDQKALMVEGDKAADALDKRRAKRRAFGVSSKNKARMEAALHCSGPRLRRDPDAFNLDRLLVACASHTLRFSRELDPECPDPAAERFVGECRALRGHERADWSTAMVPQPWREGATAPRWRAFLEWMLPDEEKRRTVQQFTGLGLLSLPVQYLMFHYGKGANGKSVFLETITRVLGSSLAVGLPRESIVGGSDRSSGGASPDIARLYGKRFVRILEVPEDVPLQEDLIKRLTGGEAIPVRSLYKGYFEFQNFATAHMSGNGFPTINGKDNGIWRRMLVVHWDQKIPEDQQGEFEDVVAGFVRDEGPGILAWLAEGVCDFLGNGLVIAPAVRVDTASYRQEMDPVGDFIRACVAASPEGRVQAHEMYQAYQKWSLANAKKIVSQTRFGKQLKALYERSEIGGRLYYQQVELHDVPEAPEPQPGLDLRR